MRRSQPQGSSRTRCPIVVGIRCSGILQVRTAFPRLDTSPDRTDSRHLSCDPCYHATHATFLLPDVLVSRARKGAAIATDPFVAQERPEIYFDRLDVPATIEK